MLPQFERCLSGLDTELERITEALGRVTDEQLWRRLRPEMNSIGNLCLHLAGNEHHYIGFGVGKTGYQRDRSGEFNANGGFSKDELLSKLRDSRATTRKVLEDIREEDFETV
ncbi:MAG: DinB family protein, partial [Planctomycetota bacterium]